MKTSKTPSMFGAKEINGVNQLMGNWAAPAAFAFRNKELNLYKNACSQIQ